MQEFGTGPGGPMISGQWINKQNGSSIYVRDSIINGDEMIIITDRGQMSMDDFSRNYIQASDEVYDEKGHVVGHSEMNPNDIVESNDKPSVNTVEQVETPKQSLTTPLKSSAKQKQDNSKETEKERLIKTIFDKSTTPTLTVNIDWTDFPKNELNMLINYFEVSKEDISKYLSKSIDPNQIVGSIVEFLDSKLQ